MDEKDKYLGYLCIPFPQISTTDSSIVCAQVRKDNQNVRDSEINSVLMSIKRQCLPIIEISMHGRESNALHAAHWNEVRTRGRQNIQSVTKMSKFLLEDYFRQRLESKTSLQVLHNFFTAEMMTAKGFYLQSFLLFSFFVSEDGGDMFLRNVG
jgi:hypothetical protein